MKPLELYIHIPFCIRKCKYCDFLSAPASERERTEYVESLCRKIRSYAELAKAYRVVTIFVGGGTPSILTEEQIQKIFTAIKETFRIETFKEENMEVTIETNPGTVTKEKLKAYKCLGINRLSIGLQSADNRELAALGRIHTYEEFLVSYYLAREAGFQNINIDLMSAIPFQTRESYEKTLRITAELKPEHISAYSLIIEEGTPFYELYGEGKNASDLPGEDTERLMYEDTKRILQDYGYHRYEISNYAKDGYECRHNLGYWERTEYLGIGTGAASLIDNRRFTEGGEPEILTREDQMAEYMFLGLRKIKGVSKRRFKEEFGSSMEEIYGKVIDDMKGKKLLEEQGDYVRLTERGIDISNYVMSSFLGTG